MRKDAISMTVVITSGAIILILALVFLGPLIEILGPLLFWLGAIVVVFISSIITIYLLSQGEIFGALIFSIPFWITVYWSNKQEDKEPVSETTPLTTDIFDQLITKYKKKLENLVDKPDELEKYVKQFEGKFSIGKKMAHMLGVLEWETTWNDNKSRSWRYKTVSRDDVYGEKEKEFGLKVGKIKVEFSEPDWGYDMGEKNRKMSVMVGKKEVAEYSTYKHVDAYYDWGKGNTFMWSFKPGQWLKKLNNLYIEWNSERLALEAQEKRKQKEESVREKYL